MIEYYPIYVELASLAFKGIQVDLSLLPGLVIQKGNDVLP